MMYIRRCVESIPCRLVIALMVFNTTCVHYMMRVNLSVNLVAMVPVANHTYSDSQVLNWTAYEKAQVLGAFFWGYVVSCAASGPLIQMLGPKRVILVTALICSVLTLLSPSAAKYSSITMVVLRIGLGIASGPTYPSVHALISEWAVETEKGQFLGMMIGGAIGTFFAWSICGLIIEPLGWEWGFYVFGIIGLICCLMLWFLVYDTPEKHPRISECELRYLQAGLKANTDAKKIIPPYSKIFLSVPCWSLFITSFGTGWGIYLIITAAPNYLASVLGYGTSSTGLLSGLIYLVRSTCSVGFGYLGDLVLKKNILSVNALRKTACFLTYVVPGCIILCMAIPDHRSLFYVTLIIIAMGLNGFVTVSSVSNAHDLTKKYIGTLTGFTLTCTSLAGTVCPYVTAFFTIEDETNEELWRPVFLTGGLVYIICGLQFLVFGSTNLQSWDTAPRKDKK